MIRKILPTVLFLLVMGLTFAPAALAQDYSQGADEAWKPKDNFWWLFASYAVIWVALFGYVARMAGKQQQLERELARLDKGDVS